MKTPFALKVPEDVSQAVLLELGASPEGQSVRQVKPSDEVSSLAGHAVQALLLLLGPSPVGQCVKQSNPFEAVRGDSSLQASHALPSSLGPSPAGQIDTHLKPSEAVS